MPSGKSSFHCDKPFEGFFKTVGGFQLPTCMILHVKAEEAEAEVGNMW